MALRVPQPDHDPTDVGEDDAAEEALIARYVEMRPGDRTADQARLGDYGMSVTAVIMALQAEDGDIARAARDYDIPVEAVEAAIAYYKRHKEVTDARITLNLAWSAD